jgi:hypothetical protein
MQRTVSAYLHALGGGEEGVQGLVRDLADLVESDRVLLELRRQVAHHQTGG